MHPLDFGGLPGEFVADLLKKLSKLDGHLFTAIRLSTFWLYFVCIPGSSSNLFGALANLCGGLASLFCVVPPLLAQLGRHFFGLVALHLRLLIQLVRRFHEHVFSVPPLLAQLGQLYVGMICLHLRLLIQLFRAKSSKYAIR